MSRPSSTRSSAAAVGTDPTPREAYHHGALRDALIDATEALIAERGAQGFSLREVARRSGVSPAAPAHHFGDAAGLLAAVAKLAFDQLTEALEAGNARGGDDPLERLCEQGVGYVGFALTWPGRFALMFRADLFTKDEALVASAHAAYQVLEDGIRGLYALPPGTPLVAGAAARAARHLVDGARLRAPDARRPVRRRPAPRRPRGTGAAGRGTDAAPAPRPVAAAAASGTPPAAPLTPASWRQFFSASVMNLTIASLALPMCTAQPRWPSGDS